MNRKGFTLVELLATLVVLAIVMSIGTYSIINIINNSKEKTYELLISHIKDSSEVYYQECKFSKETIIKMFNGDKDAANIFCDNNITIGELVEYGYLKGNSTDSNKKYTIVNPKDNNNISNCEIKISYNNGIYITATNPTGSCPTQSDYDK